MLNDILLAGFLFIYLFVCFMCSNVAFYLGLCSVRMGIEYDSDTMVSGEIKMKSERPFNLSSTTASLAWKENRFSLRVKSISHFISFYDLILRLRSALNSIKN